MSEPETAVDTEARRAALEIVATLVASGDVGRFSSATRGGVKALRGTVHDEDMGVGRRRPRLADCQAEMACAVDTCGLVGWRVEHRVHPHSLTNTPLGSR
jgi:hypothetical protein